jgi:hypothetical protein
VTLLGESPRNCRRIYSLGSDLICEGLLLGMQVGGHEDPQTRASPSEVNHSKPSFYDDTCDTPSHFFVGKVSYAAGLR